MSLTLCDVSVDEITMTTPYCVACLLSVCHCQFSDYRFSFRNTGPITSFCGTSNFSPVPINALYYSLPSNTVETFSSPRAVIHLTPM